MGLNPISTALWGGEPTQYLTLGKFNEDEVFDEGTVHVYSLEERFPEQGFKHPFSLSAPGLYASFDRNLSSAYRILSDSEFESFKQQLGERTEEFRGELSGLGKSFGLYHVSVKPDLLQDFRTTSFSKALLKVKRKFKLYWF